MERKLEMVTGIFHYPPSRLFPEGMLPVYAQRFVHHRTQPVHDHGFMELVVVIGGSALHRSPDGARPLHRGDVIVLRPGAWHGYESCHRLQIVNCCFATEMLRNQLAWMLDDAVINSLLLHRPLRQGAKGIYLYHMDSQATRIAGQLLDNLHTETKSGDHHSSARRLARLILVIEHLARHLPPESTAAAPRASVPPRPPLVLQAVRLLDQHLAHPWQTRELAERLGVDVSYAIRLVKQTTGLPPLAYLARLRAETAAGMLVRSQQPITEIGRQVGWPEPAYFARRFRCYFGLSATEYRRRFTTPRETPAFTELGSDAQARQTRDTPRVHG